MMPGYGPTDPGPSYRPSWHGEEVDNAMAELEGKIARARTAAEKLRQRAAVESMQGRAGRAARLYTRADRVSDLAIEAAEALEEYESGWALEPSYDPGAEW